MRREGSEGAEGRRTGLIVAIVTVATAVGVGGGAFVASQIVAGAPSGSGPSAERSGEGSDGVDAGDFESGGAAAGPILPDQPSEKMRRQIEDRLRSYHVAIARGDYQGAWEVLSERKRLQYRRERDGYPTWRDTQAVLAPYLSPGGLSVEIVNVDEASGVARVRVGGIGWSKPGAPCAEWSGVTWVKYERDAWYYDPDSRTVAGRDRVWGPREGELLGADCEAG